MDEMRIVGPGKTRGYPYPVCKNSSSSKLERNDRSEAQEGWFESSLLAYVVRLFFYAKTIT